MANRFSGTVARSTPKTILDIGCRIVDGLLYVPAYSQTLKGLPAVHYTIFDLLQKPMNVRTNYLFGRSPVELVMMTVNIAFRRANSQLQYFAEGDQPQAFFGTQRRGDRTKFNNFKIILTHCTPAI